MGFLTNAFCGIPLPASSLAYALGRPPRQPIPPSAVCHKSRRPFFTARLTLWPARTRTIPEKHTESAQ